MLCIYFFKSSALNNHSDTSLPESYAKIDTLAVRLEEDIISLRAGKPKDSIAVSRTPSSTQSTRFAS